MSNDPNQNNEQTASSVQPDPLFKVITRLEAEQLGMHAVETEHRFFVSRTDLVLEAPSGLQLEGTMFDFFRQLNVVEFKSQGDPYNLEESIRNQTRTAILYLEGRAELDELLNVNVVSRRPREFLKEARQRKVYFRPVKGKPWLLWARVGFLDTAIVICGELPVEKPYFNWLLFAPAGSERWKAFVEKLAREREWELLKAVA